MKSGLPEINLSTCWGCDVCVVICPNNALSPRIISFDDALAEAAQIVINSMKKSYFINYLINITEECDCKVNPGEILMENIGVVLSDNIISAEKASHDLIIKQIGYDIFQSIHYKSPIIHITACSNLGLGDLNYHLEIL